MVAAVIAAIALATGIVRATDPALMALAQQRATEITVSFEHRYLSELNNGEWTGWGEVVGWNEGLADPAASIVNGWLESPTHRPILTGPHTHIGCGHAVVDGRNYFVCILATPGQRQPDDPPLPQPEPPITLPNTAMEASAN